MKREILIAAALGEREPDLVLKNARVVNVFSGEVVPGDIAIAGGMIAGVGSYDSGERVVDLGGKFVAPGFIETEMTAAMPAPALEAAAGAIPAKRLGRPEDIAAAALFLASDGASYITGEVLKVIRALADQRTTMIIVTHEMHFAQDISTKAVFMSDGLIVEEGHPKEFFTGEIGRASCRERV